MTCKLTYISSGIVRTTGFLVALVTAVLVALFSAGPLLAQSANEFPGLSPDQRVYDRTGNALSPAQVADLQQRLGQLQDAGADAIVYTRALDATPSETLAQVEALQQAWVARTGADQDTAVAILINRNPNDPHDARAGVFVGKTFNDGNVPPSEQRDIVSEALIPPLRDGNVHASLAAGLDRLNNSIRNGPPQSAFDEWSARASGTWLPWTEAIVALLGFAGVIMLFRQRGTTDQREPAPTTARPGDLTPSLAGALVSGGPQASAIPAVILDLAARGALAIEAESEGGWMSKPSVQIRLQDASLVHNEIEQAVWAGLQQRAQGGVVSSSNLKKVSQSSDRVRSVIKRRMDAEGWLQPGARAARVGLLAIGFVAIGLAVVTLMIGGSGGEMLAVVGSVALVVLSVTAFITYGMFSRLSQAGQEAALPWAAYRRGLKQAAKDATLGLDLDAVLPDVVAMNLGGDLKGQLEAATTSGNTLRAFTSTTDGQAARALPAGYPWWIAFVSSTPSSASSGASGSMVSGAGAGGGGGAAGST